MKASLRGVRKTARREIIANFQFYVDEDAGNICEGITLNISDHGFGFLTEAEITQGQTITVTKHSLPGFLCPKAKVAWAIKGPRCIEARAEFQYVN